MKSSSIVIGGLFVTLLSYNIYVGYSVHPSRAKVFREENRPSVLRIHKPFCQDPIMVESPTDSQNYVDFNTYLGGFTNKYDRAIEKARIEKMVFEER